MSPSDPAAAVPGSGRPPHSTRHGRIPWTTWLFIGVLSTYLFCGAGQFQTVDAAQELGVAVSLRHGNGFRSDFPVSPGGGTTIGRGGHAYAGHDIGSTLLYLPFTLIPNTVSRTTTPANGRARPAGEQLRPNARLYFAASFLAPLLGALVVLVFALLLGELGFDAITSTVATLALAFTTTIWVYAHVNFDATATTLAVLAATWTATRSLHRGSLRDAFATGALLAAAVLIRIDSLVMVPFLAAPVLAGVAKRRAGRADAEQRSDASPLRVFTALAAPVVFAVAVDLAFNWFRFGSITNNGHTDDGFVKFNPRLGEAFIGQILSPGKGLLVFSPLVIVALVRWRWFLRRHAVVAGSILAASAATLLAHAAIVGWAGDQAWGARFSVVVVPLVALPLARVVDEIRHKRASVQLRAATVTLAFVGVLVQLTGVLVDFFAVVTARRLRGENTTTSLTHAAYLDGAQVLARAFSTAQPYSDLTPAWIDALAVARFDVWWVRTAQTSGWNVFTIGVPVALGLVAIWAFMNLRGALRATLRADRPSGRRGTA